MAVSFPIIESSPVSFEIDIRKLTVILRKFLREATQMCSFLLHIASNEMFAIAGAGANGQNENPLLAIMHEGPFDLSAFSYSQIPLQPYHPHGQQTLQTQQMPISVEQSYPGSFPSSSNMVNQNDNNFFDWGMADWSATGMGMSLHGEINAFHNTSG